METLRVINQVLGIVLFACYAYQLVFLLMPFLDGPRRKKPCPPHRFAVLIAARNERTVIAQLIESIRNQTYPDGYTDIYVVADNCTDDTAQVALAAGAEVFCRHSRIVGKGYALQYLLRRIASDWPERQYDAYLILDADNLLDPEYLKAMNRAYSEGYGVVTSYRNSKNYGDNWISAGYGLWFLRESRYLNHARSLLGTSCAVSGTGFLVDRRVLDAYGGWQWVLLTEDLEFTARYVSDGGRVGFAPDAVFYDEQPVTFTQSWRQRMRWARGNLQVFGRYGGRLLRRLLTHGSFACFDLLMVTMPAVIVSLAAGILNAAALFAALVSGENAWIALQPLAQNLGGVYLALFAAGALTTATEWKRIPAPGWKKILYTLTFPLFMLTYVPISLCSFFGRVTWKPIEHTRQLTVPELLSGGRSR